MLWSTRIQLACPDFSAVWYARGFREQQRIGERVAEQTPDFDGNPRALNDGNIGHRVFTLQMIAKRFGERAHDRIGVGIFVAHDKYDGRFFTPRFREALRALRHEMFQLFASGGALRRAEKQSGRAIDGGKDAVISGPFRDQPIDPKRIRVLLAQAYDLFFAGRLKKISQLARASRAHFINGRSKSFLHLRAGAFDQLAPGSGVFQNFPSFAQEEYGLANVRGNAEIQRGCRGRNDVPANAGEALRGEIGVGVPIFPRGGAGLERGCYINRQTGRVGIFAGIEPAGAAGGRSDRNASAFTGNEVVNATLFDEFCVEPFGVTIAGEAFDHLVVPPIDCFAPNLPKFRGGECLGFQFAQQVPAFRVSDLVDVPFVVPFDGQRDFFRRFQDPRVYF